ncbi:YdcF family protein [Methylolobus aquaticus]
MLIDCAISGVAAFYLASTPAIASRLGKLIPSPPPLPEDAPPAQAIVVIGGGLRPYAPEFGGCALSPLSLERIRYAAMLHRRSGLPIAVSGGRVAAAPASEADLMASALTEEFGVNVIWRETASLDTAGNARLCRALLHAAGIVRIVLVTHDWHMRRAAAAFGQAGFSVVPAAMGFYLPPRAAFGRCDWKPNATALQRTGLVLYELAAWWWYRWRGYLPDQVWLFRYFQTCRENGLRRRLNRRGARRK